jgi:hypothetical protein
MITRCFIGVDVVAVGIAAGTAVIDVKNPENRINGINSDRCMLTLADK